MKAILFFLGFCLLTSELYSQYYWPLQHYSFETEDSVFMVPDSGLWQIGLPSKTIFRAAHEGKKAMVTDTLLPITSPCSSSFYFAIDSADLHDNDETILEFWHRYDLIPGQDTAMIEFSYDEGLSWQKDLLTDAAWQGDFSSHRYFEADNSSQYPVDTVITGNSNGWVRDSYSWLWELCVITRDLEDIPNSILVRFSIQCGDTSVARDGWMIDDIFVASDYCIGVEEVDLSEGKVFPNPFSNSIGLELENATIDQVEIFNLSGVSMMRVAGVNQTRLKLNTAPLPAGMYLLVVRFSDFYELRKVIMKM